MATSRHALTLLLAVLLATLLPVPARAESAAAYATNIATLINPTKLATLGKRAANPRIQKAVAFLEHARLEGFPVATVASNAVALAGYTNRYLIILTVASLTRNHEIATKLGVLDASGLGEMRRGQSATIQSGPYTGDELSVDHIVPYSVAPELGNVIANLELMPLKMNRAKNAKMSGRQYDSAKQFRIAGLLSPQRLEQILEK